jgi:hypothetical protein
MVFAVQAALAFTTVNRRNNVLNGITARIAGRPRWSVDELISQPIPRVGANGLYAELRFVSKADQADLETRMNELFPANPPLPGSWIRLHDCPHDENAGGCPAGVLTVF